MYTKYLNLKQHLSILGITVKRYIVPKVNEIALDEQNNKDSKKDIKDKLITLKNKIFQIQLLKINLNKNITLIKLSVIKYIPTFQQLFKFIVIFIVIILLTSRKVGAYDKLEKNLTEHILKKNITNLPKNPGGQAFDQVLLLNLLKAYNEQQSKNATESLLLIAQARGIANSASKKLMSQLENLSAGGGIFFNSLSMNPSFQKSRSARLKCHVASLLLNIISIILNRGL